MSSKGSLNRQVKQCLVVCTVIGLAACSALDSTVTMVKGGTLQSCPNSTVEEMVDGFMGSPSWESGVTEDQEIFVNVSGDISYADKPVRAVVQFMIDKENETFQYNAFELNGIPQNHFIAAELLEKMCDSA